MEGKKLKVVSVVEALSAALMEDIFRMEYQPGQQITESELAQRFGVSRNTVREAITRLMSSGLVEKEANKGVFVKKIGEQDVREIFRFRAILESEAVRMIIQKGEVSDRLVHAMESIEKDPFLMGDWYRFVSSDLDFHTELVNAAESPRLSRLYEAIRHEIMLCLCQSKNTLILNHKNIYEHRHFIEVLERGDVDAAIQLVTNHIQYGIENVARGFASEVD